MADEKQGPKIIVDEDWKIKAQKEKEGAAKKIEEEKLEKQGSQQNQLPRGDFSSIVSMLATQSMFAMGLIKQNETDEPKVDLELARFNIDLLSSLEEKTKGNLTKEEGKMLEAALGQLRMAFVQISKGDKSSE